jgi:hypothetical protein
VGPIRGLWRILDRKGESGLMSDLDLRGGSPFPCRLRTDRLAPVSKFDYVPSHTGFMGSRKLSSFNGHRVGQSLTSRTMMYTRIVYRPPTDSPACGITWKMCTRERCSPPDSLIVVTNCGHLWCIHGSRVLCFEVFPCRDVN